MVWSEEDHISTVIQSRSIDSVLAHEIAQLASLAIMLKLNAEKRYKKSLSDFIRHTIVHCTIDFIYLRWFQSLECIEIQNSRIRCY